MNDAPDLPPEPANLKFLRRLVTVLTVVMIGGVVIVIALLVIRLNGPAPLPLPETITLPQGTTATNYTRGPDWVGVVTQNNRILIFDIDTGQIRQDIQIKPQD